MTKENLSRLKKAAAKAAASKSQEEKLDSLTQAFSLFTTETERLTDSYQKLSEEFQDTTKQLSIKNDDLIKKVSQLDVITRYLHNILNSISHGIMFIDLNGIISTYNGAAEAILEKDNLDVLYSSFWDHFPDDQFGFSIGEALSTRQAPETVFTTIETPSKKVKELEIHTSFVLKNDDSVQKTEEDYMEVIQGMIIVIRDRTEINNLRRQANRNDRMKELGEIAASVAHEIRNPLGGIKGFASLLHRDLSHSPQLQQMADHIITGAENLNRLVSDVLNYSRPLQLRREPTDLVRLAEDLKHAFEADYRDHPPISFEIKSKSSHISAPIDRQLMYAALLNLIVNAIQAMPQGGALKIEITEELGQAIITVSDTGIGIPEDNFEKIFSPFFTTKTNGNGFGLAEVHKVIAAHEGTISVTSEVGKWTLFTIKIPTKTFARKKS